MTDAIPAERNRQSPIPDDPIAAYTIGYADGRRLLGREVDQTLKSIRDRFVAHMEAAHPSRAEQAYVAGVRDAAADNFPSPPHESCESPVRRAA
jgi:hypothetical protein